MKRPLLIENNSKIEYFHSLTEISLPLFRFLVIISLFLFQTISFAQSWVMPVDGKVFSGGEKLTGSIVTLYKGGTQLQQVVTTSNGKFSFELPPNGEYIIAITKPGYVTKKFKINTSNVPADRVDAGNFNPFQPDVTLFEMPSAPEISKRVEAILSQPIAIYQYIPSETNFNYDQKYTDAVQSKLSELEDLQKKAEKEMAEKAKNAAQEAQKQMELDKKYKAAIDKADKSFSNTDYMNAKSGYSEAAVLKPTEPYPKQKLAEIDKLLANAGKQREIDDKYKAVIAKADGAFGKKDYTTAKAGYNEASGIKPSEQYPKTKLAEIDNLLADAGKQKEIDDKYKAAIAKADAAFGSKNYTNAKSNYTEALGLKSSESYPKTKLAEIDKLLSSADADKKKDQQYKDLIAKADATFGTKDYAGAKSSYKQASELKSSEQYPKTKIAEIDKFLADMSKSEELDKKYKNMIAKADELFGKKNYMSAKSSYADASALKPAEQYPKTKIAEIDKLLADIASQKSSAEKDQQFKDAVAKADKFFAAKDYDNAKSEYNNALGIKPAEQYPKTKLAEIDKIAAAAQSAKEADEKYKAAIAKGDNAMTTKDYSTAKTSYAEASTLKPAEQYPKQKLTELETLLKNQSAQEQNKKYNEALARAAKDVAAKDYATAKSDYQEASGIKPLEQFPKDKIAEMDKLLKTKAYKQSAGQVADKDYLAAVARGDAAFKENSFANAKVAYNEALTYKPNEQYPKDKLAEIAQIEKARGQAQADKDIQLKYSTAISRGDIAFSKKDYHTAKPAYEEALSYKPSEKYPKDRLKQIADILNSNQTVVQTPKKQKDAPAVSAEDQKKQ